MTTTCSALTMRGAVGKRCAHASADACVDLRKAVQNIHYEIAHVYKIRNERYGCLFAVPCCWIQAVNNDAVRYALFLQ